MTTGIPDLLFAIKQALAANDPGTATRLCKKVLSKSPNDLQALAFLGIAYLKMGNVDEAIQRFRRCTQIAPADFSAFENLGIALAESGDSIAGLEALKRSAELGNPSARLLANIGSLCLQIGDYDGAAAALENALRQLPANIELLTQLSVALARTGSWQTARQYAGQALALDPKTYRTHMFDGFVNLRPPNLDHAIAAFGAALNQPIEARREQLRVQELLADTIMCRDLFPAARERRASLTRTPVDAGGQALGPDGAASALALGDAVANQRDAAAGLAPSRAGQAAQAVFFHVDAGARHPFLEDKETQAAPAVDYRETLSISASWFRATQPGGRAILLTDETTPADDLSGIDAVVRLPVRSDQMMYARMRAYHALVASGRVPGPVLLLDTDVCLTRDFAPLFDSGFDGGFDGGFDIGLTYRTPPDFAHMPINVGVILVADGAAAVSARFFEICLSWYDWLADQPAVKARYDFDIRHWRGGQLSLAAFVDWTVPPYAPRDVVIDGIRIRFFPCDQYNYAVRKTDKFNLLDTKWALHFKSAGPKKLMADYQRHRAKKPKA